METKDSDLIDLDGDNEVKNRSNINTDKFSNKFEQE
jgi:hypothetical protein